MGNTGSSNRRHHHHHHHYHESHPHQPPLPPPPPRSLQQHQMNQSQYIFAAATPYPPHYQNHNQPYQQYPGGYYPPMPLQGPYGFHHYPGGRAPPTPPVVVPYVEHQKAVTIRNDVNVKKETLRVEPDDENSGKFVVAFTFDATAPGSIAVMFFAKENVDCDLIATREDLCKSVTISFQPGIGQKFRQPFGEGIDFSMFDEAVLGKVSDPEVFPLIVKAEAHPLDDSGSESSDANSTGNSQITMAVFEKKEKGNYQVKVVKQILWVNRVRYELQEIYGIGNTVGTTSEVDENDSGKECVICLSEPRDTTVLPCRHMCMCSGCAKVLQFQTNRCPICRQPVDRLLEIKVSNEPEPDG